MNVIVFINNMFDLANLMLDVVFLGGGLIVLFGYPVYFFATNLKKYTRDHRNRELISQTFILIVIVTVAGATWILPDFILFLGVGFQRFSLQEGLNKWNGMAWIFSTIRWMLFLAFFAGIAYLLGHEHGKNRWSRSMLIVSAIWLLGWAAGFWMGFLFLSIPLLAAYYSTLHDLALIVMPASNPEDRGEQKKRISAFTSFTWGTQSPMTVIDDHAWKKYDPRIPGDITWNFSEFPIPLLNKLDRPGVIWSHSHQATAVTGGNQFKRIENPGVSFAGRLERPDQIFDLRMQLRTREIDVVSKDGIHYKARYFTGFRIDRDEWDKKTYDQIRPLNPLLRGADKLSYKTGSFPFAHIRVQATLGVTSTNAGTGNSIVHWDRWAMNVIEDQTRKVLSQKNLDELWRPANDFKFANALDVIADEIKKNSELTLRAAGILLVVARVVNFSFLPKEDAKEGELDEISRQQLNSWASEWASKRNEILAKAEARANLIKEEARVYAESQLIETIVSSLQKAHAMGKNISRQVIAMRFLSALQDYTHKHAAGSEEENEELKRRTSHLRNAFKQWQEDFFPEED